MSYESMEAMLVDEILELRACERSLRLSYFRLQSGSKDVSASDLDRDFFRVHSRISEIERLLTAMDSAKSSADRAEISFVPGAALKSLEIPSSYQA